MNAEGARKAADSVFRYVERTAIREPNACRWPTLDYENAPRTNLPTVFNGAAGIALFLTDYGAEANHPAALALAGDALRWSEPAAKTHGPGFSFGIGGVAWGWLRHARAAGGDGLDRAATLGADVIMNALARGEWGICTDTMGGVAGKGEVCLALHAARGGTAWLEQAVELGTWLDGAKIGMGTGTAWPMHVGVANPRIFWGAAHGVSGIIRFLVRLHAATKDEKWLALAAAAGVALEQAAVEIHGGLNWPRGPGMPELKSQWCHGAPGVGLAFTALFESTKDQRWLAVAERAATAVVGYGDIRKNPSWCHGLAGNAEILIELHRLTKDAKWLDRAMAFGDLMLGYRSDGEDGERWQADEPGLCSPDFMCGASGAGHVFLRLASAGRLPMALP